MISTIIDGGSAEERSSWLKEQALNSGGINLIHITSSPISIGIAQIKELIVTLSISTPIKRIVWIEEAQTLTNDASGALLKILEEPPSNTTIYLTCPSRSALLPTIASRCLIKTLKILSPSTDGEHLSSLKPLFALSPGDRLQHLTDFPSDKGELLTYLSYLAKEISQTIKKTKGPTGLRLLSILATLTLSTHQDLKSNVNQTLALSHFLLHLPKTK